MSYLCADVYSQEEKERKRRGDELSKKITKRLERASLKRQNYLDTISSHLQHKNFMVTLTNEKNRKSVEERWKLINDKLKEASVRRRNHLSIKSSRLRHHAIQTAENKVSRSKM